MQFKQADGGFLVLATGIGKFFTGKYKKVLLMGLPEVYLVSIT